MKKTALSRDIDIIAICTKREGRREREGGRGREREGQRERERERESSSSLLLNPRVKLLPWLP